MSESVTEMSPEEIMDRLMAAVMDGWMRDLDNNFVNSWDFAAGTIFDLDFWSDETLTNKNLVDYLADFASLASSNLSIDKKEFVELWSLLTPEQRKSFLKDFYHKVALYGLKDFLNYIGKGLSLKDVEDYLSGKISFHDLMVKLAKKYGIDKCSDNELFYEEIAASFLNGVDLANYVSDEELKELVRKIVLPKLIKRK